MVRERWRLRPRAPGLRARREGLVRSVGFPSAWVGGWVGLTVALAVALAVAPAARSHGRGGRSARLALLPVPRVAQAGEVSNCGPSAAAMLAAAYAERPAHVKALRDALGRWTWDHFPLRRISLPGYDAGMTTPTMLLRALRHFAPTVRWRDGFKHPWLPRQLHALATLRAYLEEGMPVLALVQTRVLWGFDAPGLHWIVVRGLEDGQVVFNDPGDGLVGRVPVAQFYRAWRLDPLFRRLGSIGSFVGLVGDRPLPSARGVARADRRR